VIKMLRLLTIAGSDSGGGAGIQADLKTFQALGAYGMSVITAVTAQNTQEVSGVWALPSEAVRAQLDLVLADLGVDAIKIGMLFNEDIITAVADALQEAPPVPVVLDPVMRAKGGHPLLEPSAEAALRELLLPRAHVVTPNLPEAAVLTGLALETEESRIEAGHRLNALGARWALVKGGHGIGPLIHDHLVGPSERTYAMQRVETPHTHGTGCTLSSAIAVGLARGLSVPDAVALAEDYVAGAIQHAPGLGHGHGPLNHQWGMTPWR
jgi:hydroxymethylpyrimidine/phosphomethylpyrimidine kinase